MMSSKNLEHTAHELALVLGLLIRKMRAASPSESDFSWTQKSIIVRLDDKGPMTISDLARAEGVKSQSMGTAISALEEMRIVERHPHPTDGRQINIHLTSHGMALRKLGRDSRRSWLAQAIAKLEKQDQETLLKTIHILKQVAA